VYRYTASETLSHNPSKDRHDSLRTFDNGREGSFPNASATYLSDCRVSQQRVNLSRGACPLAAHPDLVHQLEPSLEHCEEVPL